MERTTPYATPVSRSGRILCLALAAVGLAGAGVGIGAVAGSRPPAAPPAPVVVATEAASPKPAAPDEAQPPQSAEIDRLVQTLNESEAQRREEARKATERAAELERVAGAARQAADGRRLAEEADGRRAAEQQAREEGRRAEDDRRAADERARQQAAWDALRQAQADQQAEAQRRALDDERRRLEAARRRLAERAAVAPQVTGVNLWAVAPTVHGPYPRTIPFSGWVAVDGPTTVRYRFVGSDGTVSPPRTLICPAAGRYAVGMPWRVTAAGSGSVTLEVLDPTPVTSTTAYTAAP